MQILILFQFQVEHRVLIKPSNANLDRLESRYKSASDAEKIVEIIKNNFTKTILTLTGTGAVSEYQLDYIVTYRFKSKDGSWNLPVTIETSRTYTYDDSDILAKDEEEKRLVSGMEDQLIKTMATQISLSK